jgi:hypothetical protein
MFFAIVSYSPIATLFVKYLLFFLVTVNHVRWFKRVSSLAQSPVLGPPLELHVGR